MKALKKIFVTITACALSLALSLTSFAEVMPVLTNDLSDITEEALSAINDTKLEAMPADDTSTEDVGNGKWFNVGGADANGYNAPTGGIEAAEGGVRLTNAYSGIARKIVSGANPTTGIYRIKFSVKPNGSKFAADATGTPGALCKQYAAADKRQRSPIVNISEDGAVYIPVAANPIINISDSWYIANGDLSDWYDITATYNLTDKKLGVSVKQKGKVIAAANNISDLGGDITKYGFGFVRFIATALGSDSPVIKNVTIDSCDAADLEFDGYCESMNYKIGISDAGAVSGAAKQAGIVTSVKNNDTYTLTGSALEIQSGGTTGGTAVGLNSIKTAGANAVKGILHFSYRIKVEGETSGATIRVNLRDTANKPQSVQFGTDGNIKAAGLTDGTLGSGDVATLGKFDKSEWLDVDEYVDTDSGKYSIVVKQNDAVVAKADDLNVRSDIVSNGVNSIHFIFNTAKADTKLTIDEVMLEKIEMPSVPMELNDASVTITDIENNAVIASGSKVSPAVEKISVNFGSAMPEPIGGAGIELRGDNDNVACEVRLNKDNTDIWDIIPQGLLDNNSQYTIFIPSGIADTEGATLGDDYTAVFETASISEEYSLNGFILADGTKADGIDSLGETAVTADTTAVNISAGTKELVWLFAYYDKNDACLGVESKKVCVNERDWLRQSDKPQFGANKPEGAVKAAVMLWDGYKSIMPYCDKYELGKAEHYEASAVFGTHDELKAMTIAPAIATENVNGSHGKRLAGKNLYLRCNVDNNVMYDLEEGTSVDVAVEYFDGGNGYFSLQYDSTNPDTTLYSGNTVFSQAETVQLEGANEWKTHIFRLKDMKMSDRASDSDFRVAAYVYKQGTSPGDIIISSVKVKYTEITDEPGEDDTQAPSVQITGTDAKTKVSVSYCDGKLYLSGDIADSALTLEIIKEAEANSDNVSGEDILDARQSPISNGQGLEIPFIVKNEGEYILRIRSSEGEMEEIPIYINSRDGLAKKYTELNAAAAGNAAAFAAYLNENIESLNFTSSFIDGALSAEDVDGYMNYIRSNPLKLTSSEDEVENAKQFKIYAMIAKLNRGEIKNVSGLIDESGIGGERFAELYKSVADREIEQLYLTGIVSRSSIQSVADLERSLKQALVLTAAKYAGGTDEIKKSVAQYASEAGVTYTASDAVYRQLMGKEFKTITDFAEAYNKAKASDNSASSGGSSSGGGGGGSSTSTSSGKTSITLGNDINYSISISDTNKPKAEQLSKIFIDLDGVTWAEEAVLALADKGIISGIDDERFAPNDDISREAFVKILIGAMGMSAENAGDNVFIDVNADDWFVRHVNIAYNNGLVNGIGNNLFGTGQNITREDMAVMLYNALKYRSVNMDTSRADFEDFNEISAYASDAVSALYNLGAINGMTDTVFEPKGTATRAQAAKVIYGVFEQLNR